MDSIIGHKKITDLFDRLLDKQLLSHAYCFSGPAHVGKLMVALSIASNYLHTTVSKLNSHHDFLLLNPEDKENGHIKIEEVRRCKEFLSRASLQGQGLVVCINDAHTLTNEASNALLKSIEEPHKKTVIFLITPSPRLMPLTILSRCQTIQFSTVAHSDIVNGLVERGITSVEADVHANFAYGRPGMAVSCVESSEHCIEQKEWREEARRLRARPLYEKIQLVQSFIKKDDDEQASAVIADRVFQYMEESFAIARKDARQSPLQIPKHNECLSACLTAVSALRSPANKQITLEELIFHFV